MAQKDTLLIDKINELEQEMKNTSLWQKEAPRWVNYFEEKIFADGKDFAEWLQYVFIPNHLNISGHISSVKEKKFIVPPAIKFFGEDVHKGKLLRVLIEIDGLL
jgi:uncharacterized protein YqcC (DUF446 family)